MSEQKVDPAVIQALVDKVRCSRPPADGISNPILSLNRFCQEHLKFESDQPQYAKEEVGAQIKCTVKLRDEAISESTQAIWKNAKAEAAKTALQRFHNDEFLERWVRIQHERNDLK
jgi:hypothetical protein